MKKEDINNLLNQNPEIIGVQENYRQGIDPDQIELDGVCQYKSYIVNGIVTSKEDMQEAVNAW